MMTNLAVWADFFANPAIGANPRKLLRSGGSIFTMGSCFALELRRAMTASGFATYPAYGRVAVELGAELFDKMHEGQEMPAHYDTFTMLQEFEAAFGVWTDRERGFWEISGTRANAKFKRDRIYQDPYRKSVFAISRERLSALSERITQSVREGIERSDVIVLTLGLTEVWRHDGTGKYLCRPPGGGLGGGEGLATFRASTFNENYQNMKALLELVFRHLPTKNVVLSVSPVRLEATYRGMDVGTANLESKSILRAVAGQIASEYHERVYYFPSYEIAMLDLGALTATTTVFEADGRHVQPSFVARVINTFASLTS